ncbi:MAG: penicillin-binding protein 2 [Anaerolineaceae bacterium]|nr:penicillin-binding protein 2 [Anaerolineaceae bacterium]
MKSQIEPRFRFLVIAFSVLSFVMIARICMLMLDEAAIQMKAETEEDYEYMTVEVSSERGNIYDRQGYLLAGNTVTYTIALNLQASNGHAQFIADNISNIFGLDPETVKKAADYPFVPGLNVEYTLMNDATKDQLAAFQEKKNSLPREYLNKNDRPEDLDAVIAYPNIHRYYPNDNLAYNIIGFFPYRNPANGAAYGIEQYYDDILSAKTISHRFSLDPNVPDRIPDLPNGASVVLTIDRKIQEICEDHIRQTLESTEAKSVTVIVENPKTGEILAMASSPSIDLNKYWESGEVYTRDNKFNPAVMQPYEPGSVFKVLTMAIAIDAGVVKPSTIYNDTGVYTVMGTDIMNWNKSAWGPQTMVGCMQHSLNTCMAYITDLVGAEKFYEYLDKFRIGKPTNIELAGEDYYPLIKPGSSLWTQISLSTNSFGQGLMATPIQMISAISAIANNGVIMQPHIVREIRYNGQVQKIVPTEIGRPVSAETARTVTDMLATSISIEVEDLLTEELLEKIKFAGKTGTGEIAIEGLGYVSETANASFVGWGPVDNPQFIAYVWVQEPRKGSIWGSQVSAPLFSDIILDIYPYLRLPDDRTRQCLYTNVCPTEEPEDDYYYYW